MKGGKALPPNFQQEINVQSADEHYLQDPNAPIGPQILNDDILISLGFEEGELEMFFDMAEGLVTEQELVDRYLEIARTEPFNQNWQDVNEAIDANYELNTIKPNGIAYTKHDIVKDTLESFYGDITGGKHRKKRKHRRSRKNKKTKSKRHNRRTRRYRK